ncbi:hypothetical protein LOD99_14390 [Oopsacas minuta]|uniref:Uncharacterized protein n=1 Tax=Oopsacas minuta TaxID=111878 RepID=A0AAV7KIP7_9METZ|nr:hypothetical protein LOD99_14390 [Oopsacas minuta]
MVFIIVYFSYRKYKNFIEIRNFPLSAGIDIDLKRHRDNLKIESIGFNFILILSGLELISNIILGIYGNYIFFVKHFNHPIYDKTHYNNDSSIILVVACGNIDRVVLSILPPILSLLFIVLRRAYLNSSYRKWIIGYTIYISIRSFIFLILSALPSTVFLSEMLFFPINIVDLFTYIYCCRKFYLLLKGRREEARWHGTIQDYKSKRIIVQQFLCSQVAVAHICALVLINSFIYFLQAPINIITLKPSYFNSISHGILPSITVSEEVYTMLRSILHYSRDIQWFLLTILEIILLFVYLLVCIGIIIKLVSYKKKYKHVNDWIVKPLMEKYRASLDDM